MNIHVDMCICGYTYVCMYVSSIYLRLCKMPSRETEFKVMGDPTGCNPTS